MDIKTAQKVIFTLLDLKNEKPFWWNCVFDHSSPFLEEFVGFLRTCQHRREHTFVETIWNGPRKAVSHLSKEKKIN